MQIPPKVTLTPEIVNLLAKIEGNKEFFSQLEISGQLKLKLQRRSFLKSSLYSARIEGADKKNEINNIVSGFSYLERSLKQGKLIDKNLILDLHRKVMNNLRLDAGFFRKEMGAIYNQAGQVIYLSPPPTEVGPSIDQLLRYINTKTDWPLITAMMAHLVFEKIHPFLDGNGRVGRLLIAAILKSKGWQLPVFIPFEEYLEKHKKDYYFFIDSGMREPDAYLSFMLTAYWQQLKKVKTELIKAVNAKQPLLLTPKQEEIVNIITDHKVVSFDFLSRRFQAVPKRTLRYDLKKLTDSGIVDKIGRTRGSFYRIKSD